MKKVLQFESMDDDLKNRIWNALTKTVWNQTAVTDMMRARLVLEWIWADFLKNPIDAMDTTVGSKDVNSPYDRVRTLFFEREWWYAYDFVEFVLKVIPEGWGWGDVLREMLYRALESENAGYRIIGNEVVPITDEHEIEAVETALERSQKAMKSHLSRALELLSDRKEPDYRNSIKESISAVESVCQLVAGKPNATLPDCLRALKGQSAMHPAFEKALEKLYGYTSDGGGIRHALTDESVSPTFADAKFMLVACSGFVNFLLAKASELGIHLQEE